LTANMATSLSEATMRRWTIVWSSALLLGLAGCYPEYQPENHGIGDSVVQNVAEQVINPEPNKTIWPTDLDGSRAVAAYSRYQAGRVIPPIVESISSLGGSMGGAASGAAGASASMAPP
jgi:hypothetical protein